VSVEETDAHPERFTRDQATNTVRYVVAALILRGSEVLICQRRPDQAMALKWEFPGGKMEPGEGQKKR